jgi:hypothetical protein
MDEQYVLATSQYIKDNPSQSQYYVIINGEVYSFKPIQGMGEVLPYYLRSIGIVYETPVSATNVNSDEIINIRIRRIINSKDIQTFHAVYHRNIYDIYILKKDLNSKIGESEIEKIRSVNSSYGQLRVAAQSRKSPIYYNPRVRGTNYLETPYSIENKKQRVRFMYRSKNNDTVNPLRIKSVQVNNDGENAWVNISKSEDEPFELNNEAKPGYTKLMNFIQRNSSRLKNADVDDYLYKPKTGIVTTEAEQSYKKAMDGTKKKRKSPSPEQSYKKAMVGTKKKRKSPSPEHYGGIKKIYNNVNKKTRKTNTK